MIYFTADLHFGHANIIKHCDRPFASVEEMDAALTVNWNATVNHEDEVYILGDLSMKPAAVAHEYLSALNGRKYFIRGNHDKFLDKFGPFEKDFVWIKEYFVLKHEDRYFVLFHYPIAEWEGFYRGAIHLYGHIHNSATSAENVDSSKLAFNVGADCNSFQPVSIVEIIEKAERKSVCSGSGRD